ncbi:MAG: alpha/beta fold hydrolase [Hyphomicrobiaceae bacterium]|nr:alpha/beta fold hydrolase [Hyphomicrobiaceae bacterium]
MPVPHLVLIPGLLCTRELFAAQIKALAQHASITVAEHRRSDSMAAIAKDILAAAPDRFALAGLSMGGYIAFEIMRQAPERVERLALLDTSPRPDLPEQTENRFRLVALAERRGVASAAREMFPKLVAPARQNDPALAAAFLGMAEDTGSTAFARQQRAIAARADSRPLLGSIACPTLVLVGAEDALTPPSLSVEMSTAIRGSRLAIVPHAGHLSTLEEPVAVSAELQVWLGA